MTAHDPIGANNRFDVSAAMTIDDEAQALVQDIASIMVNFGEDDDLT